LIFGISDIAKDKKIAAFGSSYIGIAKYRLLSALSELFPTERIFIALKADFYRL